MNIQDAFEITKGLRAEFNTPADRNRYIEWEDGCVDVKMDQEDGFIYITDGDATISIPPAHADKLAQIMGVADRIYRGE